MAEEGTPLYCGKRIFLGLKDLCVSYYTQKCQHSCSFCILPTRSSYLPVALKNITRQIDWVFNRYKDEIETFQQLSVGNEGSILDEKRFYPGAMNYLLKRAQAMTRLKVLSLETRPEYIGKRSLEELLRKTNADLVDTTVGFETQDDRIRNAILRKNIHRNLIEEKIRLLGRLGVRLTSYVMLKPGPLMTEEEGIREALATVDYLQEQCQGAQTALVIYLSPIYIAKGSPLGCLMRRVGYRPPKIQSVLKTVIEISRRGIPVYTGLWCENLAEDEGDFSGRDDYDPRIRNVVKEFNKTQDFSIVEPYQENIEETVRDAVRSEAGH